MTDNILAINGGAPSIASDAWVAPTATVVGSATIGPGTGIYRSDRDGP
jgi:carbonic anhydrase/acetyltransferase-like protein (isoleucine patch superfamily)